MLKEFTEDQILQVEESFKSITDSLNIKSGSRTYKKYQALFFNGAIATLSKDGKTPLLWGVCLMSGREIVEERNKNKT